MIKYIQILVGLLSGPGILFLLPFFIDSNSYAELVGYIIITQTLSVISGFGIEILAPKYSINIKKTLAIIFFLSIVIMVSLIIVKKYTAVYALKICTTSFALNLTLICQNYRLFNGDRYKYALIGLFRSLAILITIISSIALKQNIAIAYTFSCIISALFALFVNYYSNRQLEGDIDLLNIIINGLKIHIINASASIPFLIDRVLAKELLNNHTFSIYMVALSWAVPLIYIGNIEQQHIIAIKKINNLNDIFICMKQLFFKVFFYIVMTVIISLVIKPPYFESSSEFFKIWGLIALWQSIYCIVAFPIAAVIQRSMRYDILTSVCNSIIYISIFLGFLFYHTYTRLYEGHSIQFVISITMFLSFSLLVPKVFYVRHLI